MCADDTPQHTWIDVNSTISKQGLTTVLWMQYLQYHLVVTGDIIKTVWYSVSVDVSACTYSTRFVEQTSSSSKETATDTCTSTVALCIGTPWPGCLLPIADLTDCRLMRCRRGAWRLAAASGTLSRTILFFFTVVHVYARTRQWFRASISLALPMIGITVDEVRIISGRSSKSNARPCRPAGRGSQ